MKRPNYDGLLCRAYSAFVLADYHPFKGIEDEIRNALGQGDSRKKLAVLRRLSAKLAKSDRQSVRDLGREIHEKTK